VAEAAFNLWRLAARLKPHPFKANQSPFKEKSKSEFFRKL
jgi:hypothetical protein